MKTGHLGFDLGQKLSKLSFKDHCSRDPVQVQSWLKGDNRQVYLSIISQVAPQVCANCASACTLEHDCRSESTPLTCASVPICTLQDSICWAEAHIKIARMTLTVKLDRNWSSFQLANSAPPLSVTDSAIAPSARIGILARS